MRRVFVIFGCLTLGACLSSAVNVTLESRFIGQPSATFFLEYGSPYQVIGRKGHIIGTNPATARYVDNKELVYYWESINKKIDKRLDGQPASKTAPKIAPKTGLKAPSKTSPTTDLKTVDKAVGEAEGEKKIAAKPACRLAILTAADGKIDRIEVKTSAADAPSMIKRCRAIIETPPSSSAPGSPSSSAPRAKE